MAEQFDSPNDRPGLRGKVARAALVGALVSACASTPGLVIQFRHPYPPDGLNQQVSGRCEGRVFSLTVHPRVNLVDDGEQDRVFIRYGSRTRELRDAEPLKQALTQNGAYQDVTFRCPGVMITNGRETPNDGVILHMHTHDPATGEYTYRRASIDAKLEVFDLSAPRVLAREDVIRIRRLPDVPLLPAGALDEDEQ